MIKCNKCIMVFQTDEALEKHLESKDVYLRGMTQCEFYAQDDIRATFKNALISVNKVFSKAFKRTAK